MPLRPEAAEFSSQGKSRLSSQKVELDRIAICQTRGHGRRSPMLRIGQWQVATGHANMGEMTTVFLSGDPKSDELLADDPFALLTGMLLDQQVPMEVAFAGPAKLADRLGKLDVHEIAEMNPDEFLEKFAEKPAVHRFPKSMAARVQKLAEAIVDDYDGDTSAIWTSGDPTGAEVLKRLKKLPGFGEQKAKIFLALLGKQFGLQASGWREAAGDYGTEGSRRSIADVVDEDTLQEVRAFKKQAKAARKRRRNSSTLTGTPLGTGLCPESTAGRAVPSHAAASGQSPPRASSPSDLLRSSTDSAVRPSEFSMLGPDSSGWSSKRDAMISSARNLGCNSGRRAGSTDAGGLHAGRPSRSMSISQSRDPTGDGGHCRPEPDC